MWILLVGNIFASIWKLLLSFIIFIVFCTAILVLFNENVEDKYIFNKFIFIDVLLNAIAINCMRYMDNYKLTNLLLIIDAILLLSAFIQDIKNKYSKKEKICLIIMHSSAGYLLYAIFKLIMEIIFFIFYILSFAFNPLFDFIFSHTIEENIVFVLGLIVCIILTIPGLIILPIIIEIMGFLLSPILFLFSGGNFNDLDFENESQTEYIIDQYGQKCEIVNKLPSGGKFEDSHGEWHDLYGSSEYGYRDEDGNQYYN